MPIEGTADGPVWFEVPFRFGMAGGSGEGAAKELRGGATRREDAVALDIGTVVDRCGPNVTSAPCRDTIRDLVAVHPNHEACPLEDWARKFLACARSTADQLTYWRSGDASVLMTVVVDAVVYGDRFRCTQ